MRRGAQSFSITPIQSDPTHHINYSCALPQDHEVYPLTSSLERIEHGDTLTDYLPPVVVKMEVVEALTLLCTLPSILHGDAKVDKADLWVILDQVLDVRRRHEDGRVAAFR